MNSNRKLKESVIKEISDKLSKSKSLVIANYSGLNVKETQQLRNELKEKGVDIKVYKNRLFKLALKNTKWKLDKYLTGSNVFAFGMEDEISPAKVIHNFSKEHEAIEFVGGIYEGKAINKKSLLEIALLPSMEEALTKLALSLLSPLNQIGISLNLLVKEGKLTKEAK